MTSTAPFDWLAGWDHAPITDQPLRVVGIDLGTTNSTLTEIVWQPGTSDRPIPDVIEVEQPTYNGGAVVSDVVPSVVARVGGRVLVGEGARRLRGAAEPHLTRNTDLYWETKNEIGTRRSFSRSVDGFRTPADIAGHILDFLRQAAEDNADQPIDRVVITVPASFEWEQRMDTLAAAEAAGLRIRPGDLLDEPVAAYMDYLVTHGSGGALVSRARSRVLVVDFGGGTCDTAVLDVSRTDDSGFSVGKVGVSRFHRIGGADLDEALAMQVLMRRSGAEPSEAHEPVVHAEARPGPPGAAGDRGHAEGEALRRDPPAPEAEHLRPGGCEPQGVAARAAEGPAPRHRLPVHVALASAFLDDPTERSRFRADNLMPLGQREQPVLVTTQSRDAEADRLAADLGQRAMIGQSSLVLLPRRRDVHSVTTALRQRGLTVQTRTDVEFDGATPVVLTYHSAKGLTSDAVFLPRLSGSSFFGWTEDEVARLLFVGITWATDWVWLGRPTTDALPMIDRLQEALRRGDLVHAGGGGAPTTPAVTRDTGTRVAPPHPVPPLAPVRPATGPAAPFSDLDDLLG